MRNIGLLWLLLLFGTAANAQPEHDSILLLYPKADLIKLTDIDTLQKLYFNLKESRKAAFLTTRPPMPQAPAVNETDCWRLAYYFYTHQDNNIGSPKQPILFALVNQQHGETATTQQIMKAFGLKGEGQQPLGYYPLVYGRKHPLNRVWLPICTQQHTLVLRMVYSYPDGNVANFYEEYVYYFIKV